MELNFATNTTLALLNQLGRSQTDNSFEVDSGSVSGLTDSYSSSGASVDNYHTLLIRDTLQTGDTCMALSPYTPTNYLNSAVI